MPLYNNFYKFLNFLKYFKTLLKYLINHNKLFNYIKHTNSLRIANKI